MWGGQTYTWVYLEYVESLLILVWCCRDHNWTILINWMNMIHVSECKDSVCVAWALSSRHTNPESSPTSITFSYLSSFKIFMILPLKLPARLCSCYDFISCNGNCGLEPPRMMIWGVKILAVLTGAWWCLCFWASYAGWKQHFIDFLA